MSLRLLFFVVLRQLSYKPSRTAIAIAGVALGVTFMIAMSAMMTGFKTKFTRETVESSAHVMVYDELRTESDSFSQWLSARSSALVGVRSERPRERLKRIKKPYEMLAAIRKLPGVAAAAPNVIGTVLVRFGNQERGASLMGIEPDAQETVVATDAYVEGGSITDLHATGGAAIVGVGIADALGIKKGDLLSVQPKLGSWKRLKVVALFRTGITSIDENRIYTLTSVAQPMLGLERSINRLIVRLTDYEGARAVASSIEERVGYRAESWQEANANFLAIFVIQGTVTYLVTGGIMIVAAFGIFNMLVMLVVEKYPEIAMLKSMGFTARDIAVVFFIQGVAIGLVGILIGSLTGYHLVEFLGSLPIPMEGFIKSERLMMNNAPVLYFIAALAALTVTTVAAALPALRAGRLDPIKILRGR